MNTVDNGAPDDLDGWEPRIATLTADARTTAGSDFTERAICSLLRVVREQLALEVVFVGQFMDGRRVFRHISAAADEAIIQPGQFHPLDETICQRIIDGRMRSLVPDVTAVRAENGLPGYYDGMGAHIGVPVRFEDGRLYGVLCGFSFERRPELEERDVRRLEMTAKAVSRLLAQAEGHE
jgi:GAF domain-containing protein